MEVLLPFLGILFGLGWFVKILNYVIFDYYSTDMGKIGSFFMGTFMFYKKYELAEEKEKNKRISMQINNICAYVMLSVIAVLILSIIVFIIKIQ
jgi:hypothetical protein